MIFWLLLYRSDLDVLVVRWRRPLELAELPAPVAALLAAAQRSGHRRWLLDVRRRHNPYQAGTQ